VSMSLRIDTSDLIAGSVIIGDTGLGVRGDYIPSLGENGPSCLWPSLNLPTDAAVEVRGLLVTPPSVGSLFTYEDGSFILTGAPNGIYSFTFRVFADGVDKGIATATAIVGPSLGSPIVFGDVVAAGSLGGVSQPATAQQAMLTVDFTGRLLLIAGGDIRSGISLSGQLALLN
jgi:hypothetical protein